MSSEYVHKPLNSFEDADKALFFLGKEDSFITKKEAEMNSKIQTLKDKYEIETAEARSKKDLIEKSIKSFLNSNKHEFLKVRTKNLVHGAIGFRYGTPKVLLLSKKYNNKTVLELAKKIFKNKFVRSKEELAKDEIISAFGKGDVDDAKLASIGLRVDKNETEVIEINWETLDN